MNILDLDTPAIAVDLDVMEANLQQMADYAREHGLRLRPHTKTHKSPLLAKQQLDLGASGLTVAKPTEGEVMLASKPKELLIAFPTFGAAKMDKLKEIFRQLMDDRDRILVTEIGTEWASRRALVNLKET